MDEDYRNWLIEKIIQYLPNGYVRTGREINCRCPICGDSKKNTLKRRGYLNLENGSYFCHNCGASFKSGLKFLESISGEDYASIRGEYLRIAYNGNPKVLNLSSQSNVKEKNATYYIFNRKSVIKPEWKKPLSEDARKYIEGRKIDKAPFFTEKLYSYYNKTGNEFILIPWIMNNTEAYFQINDFKKLSKSGRKYIFPKNMDKLLYGIDNIDLSWKHIIVTEGVYDSLFIPNCVCCGGKYLTELQYEILTKRFPGFEISLSFDNDVPGKTAMMSAIEKFGNRYSYFIWFDKNTEEKDINDFILSNGNVNYFNDKTKVEHMIYDQIITRMMFNGI